MRAGQTARLPGPTTRGEIAIVKTGAEIAIGAGIGTLIYQVVRVGFSGIDVLNIVFVVMITQLVCILTLRASKKKNDHKT